MSYEIEMIEPDGLKPCDLNPKIHPEKQIKMLKKSIKEFGFTNPILLAKDGMIVAGHARWQAAVELKMDEVPIIRLDLPYEKALAYVVADNRLAEIARSDKDDMASILSEVKELIDDVEVMGYTDEEIDRIISASLDEEDEPEMEFSEGLYEEHNYVVLYFDNSVDWLTAVDKLGIKTVQTLDSKEGYVRQGIGRVIRGVDVVRRL
jgi:ParB-like chromosome segregation protein Spo0J